MSTAEPMLAETPDGSAGCTDGDQGDREDAAAGAIRRTAKAEGDAAADVGECSGAEPGGFEEQSAGQEQRDEEHDLHESGPPQIAEGHRPRIEERDLDVEQQEDHRHEVELHRLPLTGVACSTACICCELVAK